MRVTFSWLCATLCALSAGCATGLRTIGEQRHFVARTADVSSPRQAFEQRHGGRITDHDTTASVEQIVNRLTGKVWRGPTIRVAVLASDEPNAYVLASGYLYVTTGMLDYACTDDELAAVIAHELAHLEEPDAFDRSHHGPGGALAVESEADERAVTLLIDGQYDPRSLIEMIRRLAHAQPSSWADYRCEQLFACLDEQPERSAAR